MKLVTSNELSAATFHIAKLLLSYKVAKVSSQPVVDISLKDFETEGE